MLSSKTQTQAKTSLILRNQKPTICLPSSALPVISLASSFFISGPSLTSGRQCIKKRRLGFKPSTKTSYPKPYSHPWTVLFLALVGSVLATLFVSAVVEGPELISFAAPFVEATTPGRATRRAIRRSTIAVRRAFNRALVRKAAMPSLTGALLATLVLNTAIQVFADSLVFSSPVGLPVSLAPHVLSLFVAGSLIGSMFLVTTSESRYSLCLAALAATVGVALPITAFRSWLRGLEIILVTPIFCVSRIRSPEAAADGVGGWEELVLGLVISLLSGLIICYLGHLVYNAVSRGRERARAYILAVVPPAVAASSSAPAQPAPSSPASIASSVYIYPLSPAPGQAPRTLVCTSKHPTGCRVKSRQEPLYDHMALSPLSTYFPNGQKLVPAPASSARWSSDWRPAGHFMVYPDCLPIGAQCRGDLPTLMKHRAFDQYLYRRLHSGQDLTVLRESGQYSEAEMEAITVRVAELNAADLKDTMKLLNHNFFGPVDPRFIAPQPVVPAPKGFCQALCSYFF